MVLRGTSTPPQAAVRHCRLPLHQLSLLLMKKWQVHVISLWMCPTTVKQLFRCTATAYLSCSLSSSQNVSNGSPTQGLHMCLYTWWLCTLYFTTNWLLKVAVVLSHNCSLSFFSSQLVFVLNQWDVLTGIARAFYWQALMDLYALRWISSEATRSLNVRITPLNNDFTALLFWEAKWPSASSASTVTIVSCAKTKMPTCLYCTDNNFIEAVRIDYSM